MTKAKFQTELRKTLLEIKEDDEQRASDEGPMPYRKNRPAYREGFNDAIQAVGLEAGILL